MSSGHSHSHAHTGHERALWWALGLTTAFLAVELVGAYWTKSLALLSDAAHMLTDVAALGISLLALRFGKRSADDKRTFGYARMEILAAAFNATLLFLVAIYILYEAYQRLQAPESIQSGTMLVIATIGLVVNLISMRLLSSGSESSLNVKGAYLEVWSDLLGSVGVIVAALAIRWTGWLWIDSAIGAGIGLWVLPRTWTLLKESLNVLMQGVPEGIDLPAVERVLLSIEGVRELHDLHIWCVSSGRNVLSVHVIADLDSRSVQEIVREVRVIALGFEIRHTTVQVESKYCESDAIEHRPDAHDGYSHGPAEQRAP
ncbi:MAG: cation transporter [Proteobacteria bacterium]|nr:cation transporter [Pseudomonadota bacterium]